MRRLQGAHEATMLSHVEDPPLERGTTWSTVRLEREPQYWQVLEAVWGEHGAPGDLAPVDVARHVHVGAAGG